MKSPTPQSREEKLFPHPALRKAFVMLQALESKGLGKGLLGAINTARMEELVKNPQHKIFVPWAQLPPFCWRPHMESRRRGARDRAWKPEIQVLGIKGQSQINGLQADGCQQGRCSRSESLLLHCLQQLSFQRTSIYPAAPTSTLQCFQVK